MVGADGSLLLLCVEEGCHQREENGEEEGLDGEWGNTACGDERRATQTQGPLFAEEAVVFAA